MTRGMVKFSRQRLLGNVEPKTFPSPLEPAVVSPFSSSPTSPVSLSFLRHLPLRSLLFCYPTERVSPPRGSFLLSYPLAVTLTRRGWAVALSRLVFLFALLFPVSSQPRLFDGTTGPETPEACRPRRFRGEISSLTHSS